MVVACMPPSVGNLGKSNKAARHRPRNTTKGKEVEATQHIADLLWFLDNAKSTNECREENLEEKRRGLYTQNHPNTLLTPILRKSAYLSTSVQERNLEYECSDDFSHDKTSIQPLSK
jgi:hypothetical protein